MENLYKNRIYRISYFIKILNSRKEIKKRDAMVKFSIGEKTFQRNMLIVTDIMRELYGKIVIWDRKKKHIVFTKVFTYVNMFLQQEGEKSWH